MRHLLILLLFSMLLSPAIAQNDGSITTKQLNPKAGQENVFIYHPPKGLFIPAKVTAQIIYLNKSYFTKNIPLERKGDSYEFSYKAPDSTNTLLIGIVDEKKKVVDNNNEKGYLTYLCDTKGNHFSGALINAARLMTPNGYGSYYLKLNISPGTILNMYEKEYAEHPAEKDESYITYLSLLYKENKDAVKPQMLAYADKMLAIKNDEAKWTNAVTLYRLLKMVDEQKKTEYNILASFPQGNLAKQRFMTDFNKLTEPDKMVQGMNEYISRFKDNTVERKENFYRIIAMACSEKKDWDGFTKYSNMITDKSTVVGMYNSVAWTLSGESIDKPGENLSFAKSISLKSLLLTKEMISSPSKYRPAFYSSNEDFVNDMQLSYRQFADTYALILYKLNEVDSAFYYQDIAVKDNESPDVIERYALFSEKVKGPAFARAILEKQLLSGSGSAAMKTQLQAIYKKEGVPEAEYNKLAERSLAIVKEKLAAEIKEKMKNFAGTTFTLKNLAGDNVSLASLQGKVVVLDFWATWCGPCKASFPAMQTAQDRYKDDKDVVFLFIDTWESKEPKAMMDNASQFVKDNKYSFNVALDEKDKVVTDYKVDGIPTKFVVDRKGNVKYASIGYNGKGDELVEELSLMIETAKK